MTLNVSGKFPEAIAQSKTLILVDYLYYDRHLTLPSVRYAAFCTFVLANQSALKDSVKVKVIGLGLKATNAFVDCKQLDMVKN